MIEDGDDFGCFVHKGLFPSITNENSSVQKKKTIIKKKRDMSSEYFAVPTPDHVGLGTACQDHNLTPSIKGELQ